jgi:hypothetical protein
MAPIAAGAIDPRGSREGEDHQQEAQGRNHLGEQMGLRGGACPRAGSLPAHPVRDDGTRDAPEHLGGYVCERLTPAQAAEARVDEGDDRVEVCARDRPEHQDDREEPRRGCGRVLEQLEPGVIR